MHSYFVGDWIHSFNHNRKIVLNIFPRIHSAFIGDCSCAYKIGETSGAPSERLCNHKIDKKTLVPSRIHISDAFLEKS